MALLDGVSILFEGEDSVDGISLLISLDLDNDTELDKALEEPPLSDDSGMACFAFTAVIMTFSDLFLAFRFFSFLDLLPEGFDPVCFNVLNFTLLVSVEEHFSVLNLSLFGEMQRELW